MKQCVLGDKRVRTNVAAFNDDSTWNLVEEMTPNTPPRAPTVASLDIKYNYCSLLEGYGLLHLSHAFFLYLKSMADSTDDPDGQMVSGMITCLRSHLNMTARNVGTLVRRILYLFQQVSFSFRTP